MQDNRHRFANGNHPASCILNPASTSEPPDVSCYAKKGERKILLILLILSKNLRALRVLRVRLIPAARVFGSTSSSGKTRGPPESPGHTCRSVRRRFLPSPRRRPRR